MKAIIKKSTQALGVYELKYPLDCNCDVMGKEFEIHLNNVVGKILFPKLSPTFIRAQTVGQLDDKMGPIPGPVSPIDDITWGNKQDGFGRTTWGQTMAFPKGNSIIKNVMLRFSLPDTDFEKSSQTIYDCVNGWFERFYDICEIVTLMPMKKKEPTPPKMIQGYGFRNSGLILYTVNPNTKKPDAIHNKNDHCANITLELPTGCLKYDELVKIIDMANKQKELSFSFKCFLEGLRAFFNEDYKKAITVCSPALEAALLTGIEDFAKKKNIYFLEKLLKKYRMLGGYFALANDIDMTLPTQDYKTALVELRNNVVHNGYDPTAEEAEKYLKDVRLYLDNFSKSVLSE